MARNKIALIGAGQIGGTDCMINSMLRTKVKYPGPQLFMTSTDKVVPYFDLSFQHASGPLLRRMRRFGDAESFLGGRVRLNIAADGHSATGLIRSEVAAKHERVGRIGPHEVAARAFVPFLACDRLKLDHA